MFSASMPASTASTTAPATATASSTTAAGAAGSTTAAAAAAEPAKAAAPAPISQLPRLKNKTMDEIITRWASDLQKYQKEFKGQAEKISKWDRLLIENGEKIQKLFISTHEAEKATNEIDRQLQAVESQQNELEAYLDKYEKDIDALFEKEMSGSGDQLSGADQERERTYKLAENVTDRLDEMGKDLGKMISEINSISGSLSKGNKPDDPVSAFCLESQSYTNTC